MEDAEQISDRATRVAPQECLQAIHLCGGISYMGSQRKPPRSWGAAENVVIMSASVGFVLTGQRLRDEPMDPSVLTAAAEIKTMLDMYEEDRNRFDRENGGL